MRCDSNLENLSAGNPSWISVLADVKLFASRVNSALAEVSESKHSSWGETIANELNGFDSTKDFVDRSGPDHVDLRSAMVALNRLVPMPRTLVSGSGRSKTPSWRFLTCSEGGFIEGGTGFQVIGLNLPIAIGASFANRERVTVCVSGDGGAMMSIPELAVAVEHKLPLIFAVANDSSYGSEYSTLESEYPGLDPTFSKTTAPTFASLAAGFGAKGYVIRNCTSLNELQSEFQDVSLPIVLDIKMDPQVNPDDQWLTHHG